MAEEDLVPCPYCRHETLVTGYFCAFCGAMLRQLPVGKSQPSGQLYHPAEPETYKPYGDEIPGGVPFVICTYCQTPNQPWRDVCKTCNRPLHSTSRPQPI